VTTSSVAEFIPTFISARLATLPVQRRSSVGPTQDCQVVPERTTQVVVGHQPIAIEPRGGSIWRTAVKHTQSVAQHPPPRPGRLADRIWCSSRRGFWAARRGLRSRAESGLTVAEELDLRFPRHFEEKSTPGREKVLSYACSGVRSAKRARRVRWSSSNQIPGREGSGHWPFVQFGEAERIPFGGQRRG
jgi:hypothetical protein